MATQAIETAKAPKQAQSRVTKGNTLPRHKADPFKPTISKDQKAEVLSLVNAGHTQVQVAEMTGIPKGSVSSIVMQAQRTAENGDDVLRRYQRLLRKRMPVSQRVSGWVELAKQNSNPFVRTRALQRIEELDGIVTEKERRDVDKPAQIPPSLFVMAPGSVMMVSAAPPRGENRPDNAPEASIQPAKSPEVIDIKAITRE